MFRRTKSALSQLSCTIFGASDSASPGNTTSSLAVETAAPNEDMMESGGVLSPSKQSSDPSMRNSLKDQPAIAQISSPHNSLAGDLSGPCELPSNPAPADQPIMFRRTKSALSQLSCTIFGASGSASPGNTTSSLAVEIAEPNEDMIAQRIQDSDVTKVKQPGSESLSPIPIPGPGPEQSPSGFVLRRAETSTSESTRYAKRDKAPSA